jgi:Peroxisome biogenesis factor 1, N-terminal
MNDYGEHQPYVQSHIHFYLPTVDDDKILDLPACLIPKGCSENSYVAVEILTSIQDAETLHVDPLTCEDWELLETRAQFLEDGALLQQVTVVYSEQILPLWVGKQDVAWIRVLPENFTTEKVSGWPSSDEGESEECIRLVRDTRVIVRPKTRREGEPLSYPCLRVFPTRQDYSTPANKLAESLGKKQVSTSPGTVVLHPEMRLQIPGLGLDDSSAVVVVRNSGMGSPPTDDPTHACILQVVFSDLVPAQFIGKNTFA